MRIIVTGGAGFIGSNLATGLEKNHEILAIDDFSSGDYKNLSSFNGRVLTYDIRNLDWGLKFKNEKIDVIFHEAAISDTRANDQRLVMEVNVNAFKNLLDFSVKNNVKLVYASSAAVYGRGKSPMKEEQKLCPLNVYGFSKKVMDNLALDYIKKYKKSSIIGLRYFNVFGPNENHKNNFASMIWQLFLQMKSGKRPRIFKDGSQTRDHIYVKDVVQANKRMISYAGSGIFNVGTGVETSFNDIVSYLNETLKTNLVPEYVENPYDFFQNRTCADISKIIKAVSFKPEYSIKQGIIDYFKNNGN